MRKPNVNEATETAAFEALCGSVERAQRLFRLYKNSHGTGNAYEIVMGRGRTKEQIFQKRAVEEGFTMPEINAFFRLQN